MWETNSESRQQSGVFLPFFAFERGKVVLRRFDVGVAQTLRNVGDVRTGSLEHRGERMPGRIGRNVADAEGIGYFLHPPVDDAGKGFGLGFQLYGCLLAAQHGENVGVRRRGIAPFPDDFLHQRYDDSPNRAYRFRPVARFLTNVGEFAVLDVAVAQLDEIRDIQSVAQIEKKPVVAVAESRIFAVVVFGDRSYLLDGECHFSARTLLDGIAPLPERIVHLFDDAVGFRAVEYPAERSHVDGDSCLAFALRVHEILEPHEPRGRNVLILQIAGRELAHGPQQCSKDIRRTDVARGPLFFFARGNGFQYGFRAAAFDAGVEQTEWKWASVGEFFNRFANEVETDFHVSADA